MDIFSSHCHLLLFFDEIWCARCSHNPCAGTFMFKGPMISPLRLPGLILPQQTTTTKPPPFSIEFFQLINPQNALRCSRKGGWAGLAPSKRCCIYAQQAICAFCTLFPKKPQGGQKPDPPPISPTCFTICAMAMG